MTKSKQISVHLDSLWYFWRYFSISDTWYCKNIWDCYSTVICSLGVWNKLQKLLQFVLHIFCGFLNALSFSLVLPSWTVATKTILQYSLPVESSPSITIIAPLASAVSLYMCVHPEYEVLSEKLCSPFFFDQGVRLIANDVISAFPYILSWLYLFNSYR